MFGQLGLRAGLDMKVGKWVRNVAFTTHVILGGTRRQKWAHTVMEVGQNCGLKQLVYVSEKLKDKSQKETKHN
jgi:hypothetical protein